MTENFTNIIDLNVGGVQYTTSKDTLIKNEGSLLCSMFSEDPTKLSHDSKGRVFIDRDGVLFRYILDFLRNGVTVLPENFQEDERLKVEAKFYQLDAMLEQLNLRETPFPPQRKRPSATDMSGTKGSEGFITVGYRGTFAFGRGDMSDVKFRKLTRILVHGKSAMCREVFQDCLNESRDPDRGLGSDRYTSRYFLKHTVLEQAFDQLCAAGFRLVGSSASGTSAPSQFQDVKPGQQVTEEEQWNHYNEFVFVRGSECQCYSARLSSSRRQLNSMEYF